MADKERLIKLIQQIARADKIAFQELYEATSARLFSICLRMLKRRDWAEEILQEAYVRIWYHASEYHMGRGEVMTWMISITRHLAIDRLRLKSETEHEDIDLDETIIDGGLGPAALVMQGQSSAALYGCIEELTETQKASIALAFFEGLSHPEITAKMEVPIGTVKSWIRRGLQSLRRCLER